MPSTFVASEVRLAPVLAVIVRRDAHGRLSETVSETLSALRSGPVRPRRVLAVIVRRDAHGRLSETLSALRSGPVRPRRVLLVTTVSGTPGIVTDVPDEVEHVAVDGVLRVSADTDDAEAVARAVDHARQRWDDLGDWVWPLYDGRVPAPDCLASLVEAAETAPSTAVLAPFPGERNGGIGKSDRDGGSGRASDVPESGALVPLAFWDGPGTDGPLLCVPRARLQGLPAGEDQKRQSTVVAEDPAGSGDERGGGRLSRLVRTRWSPPVALLVASAVVAWSELRTARVGPRQWRPAAGR